MNTLQRIVMRHPSWFGLEWSEADEFFPTDNPKVAEVRAVRQIRGPWYFVDEGDR